MHAIMNDPAAFDLDEAVIGRTPVAFEIYWDITTSDARQIFHDRNLFGVSVAKTLALSMDQRDFGTTIAQRVLSITEVSVDGKTESFSHFVNARKRQLGQNDSEWMTLSALRSLCVTVLLGKPGIEATSGTIEKSDLSGLDPQAALNEVSTTVSNLVRAFSNDLATRSALTAPAVLAGVGAAAHRTTSWTREEPRLTSEQLHSLLRQVRWEREEKYWEGVAAKRTASGGLSFAGGAKDSGHRVCDAIINPDSDLGKRIRGR
ncbi:DNA-sulfur modification-associated [Micromonospora citrea]|uniref:DNA-sulfur modification-associated n=2 Tax=Micromonospora citrea TaxID=47855 RepID=A0A1C6UUC5_9ACTN|nr:DNA-sulfur modification-associated [Micromonospora citrea]